MKKVLLSFAVLAGLALPSRVHASDGAIMQSSLSSFTVAGLDISSSPAVSVLGGANLGWRQVCVQNLDTSVAAYCGDTVNVSSITTNGLIGVVIAPASSATQPSAPTCFFIVQNMNFFCRSGSTSGTSRAVIIKAK